jgi:hypothetical protein
VRAVILPLATVATVILSALFRQANCPDLIWLGVMAGAAFGVQIFLKKAGRSTRMAAEVVGALALTSTAPAAYCVGTGRLDHKALVLWLVNWLFAADQVHFVWLRIRGMRAGGLRKKIEVGLEFPGGKFTPRRDSGACLPAEMAAGNCAHRVRSGLFSRPRLVRTRASANCGSPTGLDRTGPCAGLRCTPHRRVRSHPIERGRILYAGSICAGRRDLKHRTHSHPSLHPQS